MKDPTAPSASNSLQQARQRDATIRWLLQEHPVTAAQLVQLGLFPGKNKALQRLRRLVRRGQVRLVGTVCRGPGRPEHVYCRWRPGADQMLHEVELTELCLRLDAGTIRRGPAVLDRHVLPDAEVRIGSEVYYLELDRGTMSYAQLARRFRLYEGCPHLSLWVCSTAERMDGLRERAGTIEQTALFTTRAEALAGPHGAIWRDRTGMVAALPRENCSPVRPGPETDGELLPDTRDLPSPRAGIAA